MSWSSPRAFFADQRNTTVRSNVASETSCMLHAARLAYVHAPNMRVYSVYNVPVPMI